MRESLRSLGGAACILGALTSAAYAQTPAAAAPSDLEIPGGVAPLARVLGLDPETATGARIVVEIAHLVYGMPDGQGDNARMLPVLRQYFDAIEMLNALASKPSPRDAATPPPTLDALGLGHTTDPARIVPLTDPAAQARRDLLERAGIDVTQIAEDFNRGQRMTLARDPGRAPLPLGADAWARLLPPKIAAHPLYRAILEDRQACLLYTGLAALDPGTLDAIGSIRDLPFGLYERASAFAATSGALKIRNGAVVPPGGPDAAALWESAVGERLTEPGAFVRRLFSRDNGRVAYLFSTVASLDSRRQRFALGLWIRAPDERRERFRRLTALFVTTDESWRIRTTAFSRPAIDPSLVLHLIAVMDDGSPVPPGTRAFWSAVLSDSATDRPPPPSEALHPAPADAAWLLARVLDPPVAIRRPRFERLLFATRMLAGGTRDVPSVIAAAHGFARFPALMLTLERLQIHDAAVYGEAARHAAALDGVDGAHAAASLALFQGSLAIVERARFARTISPETAASLVRSLVAAPLSGAGYEGAIARWFDESLLPAIAGRAAVVNADTALLRALAGVSPASPAIVTWEGVRYRVDVADAEVARLARLRRDQRVNPVAAVLAFARAAADTAPGMVAIPQSMRTALGALALDRDPPALGGLRDLLRDAQQAAREGRLSGRDRARLIRLGDRLLAYSLMALVYAAGLGDADADPTTIFDPTLGDRHEFATAAGGAWTIPREESGAGQPWHLRGSLLGLDLGLARFQLKRLSMEPPSQAPRISSNDRQTFAESVTLMNPHDLRDADLAAIAAAIAGGRRRAADVTAGEVDAIDASAGLGGWRREALRWSLRNDPAAVPSLFSLVDLLWLGSPPPALLERLDAWGASVRPIDGSLRLLFPRPLPWPIFSGRPSLGLLAPRTPDVVLRVAVGLAELKLPAALARGVAAAASLDLVDEAPFGHHDDRLAVAHYAEAMTLGRIQDYVSFLTAAGPLIPMGHR